MIKIVTRTPGNEGSKHIVLTYNNEASPRDRMRALMNSLRATYKSGFTGQICISVDDVNSSQIGCDLKAAGFKETKTKGKVDGYYITSSMFEERERGTQY